MADFKRILFPVDFSPRSTAAAPYVAGFAHKFEAEIILLHTEAMPVEVYVWEPQTEYFALKLKEFAAAEFPGLPVRELVTTGDAALEIVSRARKEKVDLIMMPTHGRGPFRRFVLGSVTAKVLHDTPCPVWTSAHLSGEPIPAVPDFTDVLCAIDLDDVGEHTLRYANGLAGRLGAKLTIAHAVPAVETVPEAYLDTEFRTTLMESARKRLAEMQFTAGTKAAVCVGSGNVARFVKQAAQAHRAGLVVIGRGGHGPLGRLRTNDYAIIRDCECPVLSI